MELFVKALAEKEKPSVDLTMSGDDVATPAKQPGQESQIKDAAGGAAPQKPKGDSKKSNDKDDDEPMALD